MCLHMEGETSQNFENEKKIALCRLCQKCHTVTFPSKMLNLLSLVGHHREQPLVTVLRAFIYAKNYSMRSLSLLSLYFVDDPTGKRC